MSTDGTEEAFAVAEKPDAMQHARALLLSKGFKSQQKIDRIQRERKTRANVERIDGRTIKKGHDRTAQVNIKVVPALKQRLVDHCERNGISLADWMEFTLTALGAG